MLLITAVAAANPALPITPVDLNEAGRVMATLDDWRAIMLAQLIIMAVLIALIIGLVIVVVRMAGKRSSNDEATLTVVKENTAAMSDHAASIRAIEVLLSRWEAERDQ